MRKDETRMYVALPGGFTVAAASISPPRARAGWPSETGRMATRTAGGVERDVSSCAGEELGDEAESPGQQV